MKRQTVIAAAPGTEFVRLARTPSGTLYRKEILKIGDSFVHPNDPKTTVRITRDFAASLRRNFEAGYCDTVQFPEVDSDNHHTESPSANRGEVVDVTFDDESIYATIDVRKNPEDVGKVLLGASAMMSLNYTDTRTGRKVGPTLLHVAGTNRPYVTNLKPYEPVIAMSADTTDEVVMLTHVEDKMELDELLEVLKDEHGVDVVALQELAERGTGGTDRTGELVAAMSAVLKAADPDIVSLSGDEDEITVKDVAEAVVELARAKSESDEQVVALSSRLETIEGEKAEVEVDDLVRQGRILPAQRDAMLELRLSNQEMFDKIVPVDSIVGMDEEGVTTHERPGAKHYEDLEAEITRLSNTVKTIG